jgi:hypothetical protein
VARAALGLEAVRPDNFEIAKRASQFAAEIVQGAYPKDPSAALNLSEIRKQLKAKPLLEEFGMWLARSDSRLGKGR